MVSIKRSDFFHDIFAACFRALGPLRNEFCSAGRLCNDRRHLYLHVDTVECIRKPLGRDVRANGGRMEGERLASAEAN